MIAVTQLFARDLDTVVDLALSLKDGPRKGAFLRETLRQLRALRTDTTINSHFVVLSSLVLEEGATETEEEEGT